jgi:hypothetical protein
MPETSTYVRRQAARITPAVLEQLVPKLPLLKMEFTQLSAPGFPDLFEQLEFLADLVEDFAEGADKEIPYLLVAEAAFALLYVHKHCDLIPGRKESPGHADSSVVRSVLLAHGEDLAAYAARHDVVWTGAGIQP